MGNQARRDEEKNCYEEEGESFDFYLMLCFRENIFLIFEVCSKNSRRRGGKRPEREKKNIDKKKEVQERGKRKKYMPKKEERGVHAHFFL